MSGALIRLAFNQQAMANLRIATCPCLDLARRQGKTVFYQYVKFGDIGSKITPEVKQVFDSQIYVEWPKTVSAQKTVDHFFDRLVSGIRR